jgi:hypothetical protein
VNEFTTGVFVVLTVLVMVVGMVVGMALAARRLLGARFGAVRLLPAGAVALLVAMCCWWSPPSSAPTVGMTVRSC